MPRGEQLASLETSDVSENYGKASRLMESGMWISLLFGALSALFISIKFVTNTTLEFQGVEPGLPTPTGRTQDRDAAIYHSEVLRSRVALTLQK